MPVVVRSPNWLGDAVMTLPAVRNLKTLLGNEPLTVASPAKLVDLWKQCPFVDRVLTLESPKSLWKTSVLLRKEKFKAAVLFPNSLRVAAEATLAAIPQIIGYPGNVRRWLLTHEVEPADFSFSRQHQKYNYIDLVSALGGPEDDGFPSLAPDSSAEPIHIGLCPGAEYGPAKRWPAARFTEVAKTLSEKHKLPVVILGAAVDRAICAEIAKEIPGAVNRAGETTLAEFIREIRQSKVVICNDSGAMHVASALGVPTVAIFGSTEPRRTGPLGPRTDVIRHHVPCSPCFLRECPLDFSCMTGITPEKVIEVADARLSGAVR